MDAFYSINNWIDQIQYPFLLPYFIAIAIHFICEPLRWVLYTHREYGVQVLNLVKVFCFTALLAYMLPFKLGLPARILLLRKEMKLGFTNITAHLTLDGVLYYSFWGISAAIAVVCFWISSPAGIDLSLYTWLAVATLICILILPYALRALRRRKAPKQKTSSIEGFLKIRRLVESAINAFNNHTRYIYIGSSVIVILDILSHVLRHWALLSMLDISLGIGVIAIVTCISIFVGLVSMMPMGLGGYDVTLALLLSQFGVPVETAILLPLINRVGTLAFGGVVGLWSAWGLRLNPLNNTWRAVKQQ